METNSKKSAAKTWIGTICFGLMLLASPQRALAQANTFPSSGNVGVGTTTPSAKLDIVGASGPLDRTGTAAPAALKVLGGTGGNGAGAGPGGIGGAIALTGGTGGSPFLGSQSALGGPGGAINITGGTGGPNVFNVGGGKGGNVLINGGAGVANSPGNIILSNLGGNVGIGMSNPAFRLDVNGEINATGLRINGAPIATGGSSQWTTSGSSIYYLSNVGLGVTAPNESLSVFKTAAGWQGRFANSSGSGADVYLSHGGGYGMHIRGWNSADNIYTLQLYNNTVQTNVFYNSGKVALGLAGNVGIGNANPTEKLDITGNIKVTGTGNITAAGTITATTINAKYQDVAEWVESSQSLPAGTVVVLDHTKSNQVVASTQSYDTRVAGVISAQPGIALGESGETKVLVATTGRVRIKVDATRAPILIGDLLVTSDISGIAMKSEPIKLGGRMMHMPGTLVGKALEPMAKGTGEILVLLSLQ